MSFVFDILRFTGIFLLVILLFNFVILVHEWGHFLAARWRGLRVDKFQIWFGKPIWKKTINGVQYGLGTIPFGGFVALPQMAPMEAIEGKSDGTERREILPPISPVDKIIVAFAGPLFSFLLAVFFAFIVWGVGKPTTASEMDPRIGYVANDGPAKKAGLQVGDVVKSIDGKPVHRFMGMIDSVVWGVASAESDNITFVVERGGREITVVVHAPANEAENFKEWEKASFWTKLWGRPPLRQVRIGPHYGELIVDKVLDNSPGAIAGIQPGDKVLTANGEALASPGTISDLIELQEKANSEKHSAEQKEITLTLEIERVGKKLVMVVKPKNPATPKDWEAGPITGIAYKTDKDNLPSIHLTPWAQVSDSVRTTFATLAALISPKSKVSASHMSSAVGIMNVFYQLFKMDEGWKLALWFAMVLNVNLAILNLLPLPVIDGGHITMALIEIVTRRPLRGKLVEYTQAGFVFLLFGFMLWVMLKDFGSMTQKEEPISFQPVREGADTMPHPK